MKLKRNLGLTSAAALWPLVGLAVPQPQPFSLSLSGPAQIRVRLAEAVPLVRIRGEGLKFVEKGIRRGLASTGAGGGSAPRGAHEAPNTSLWEIRCQDGRVRAVSPAGGRTLELAEPARVEASARPGSWILFHDRPYRDAIEIRSVGSLCEVVNHVDLERYLGGLVNSEFSSKWNDEAIGAQIVAARTYALHQMRIARADADRSFDVDATTRDQVYDGSMKEDAHAHGLVERTRGLVLTTGDASRPSPLKAFYHSTCGGMTELPEHVWGGSFAGFKRAVKCPYCAGSPAIGWQLELSSFDVAEAFRRARQSADLGSDARPEWSRGWPADWRQVVAGGRLLGVQAGRWDLEGRVSEIITRWTYKPAKTGRETIVELRLSGARFRDWVGPAKFKSANFQVMGYGNARWRFQGRGNGHGVGMCQWGAKTMGERGFKTASILKFYYPDAALRKMW